MASLTRLIKNVYSFYYYKVKDIYFCTLFRCAIRFVSLVKRPFLNLVLVFFFLASAKPSLMGPLYLSVLCGNWFSLPRLLAVAMTIPA